MPIHNVSGNKNGTAATGAGTPANRTTFRPPWVKQDGEAPAQPLLRPWSQRQKNVDTDNPPVEAKLQSREVKVPVATVAAKKTVAPVTSTVSKGAPAKSTTNEDVEGVKNGLRSLLRKSDAKDEVDGGSRSGSRTNSVFDENSAKLTPGALEKPGKFVRPLLKKVARPEPAPIPPKAPPLKPVVMAPLKKDESDDEETESEEEETEEETETETETETESESEDEKATAKKSPPKQIAAASKPATNNAPKVAAGAIPPPPPPPPGGPPPPPPPPPMPSRAGPPADFEKKPMSSKHRDYLERLRNRPRRRPDWSDMMKEVESGRKLRHVQCNDRSSPILTSKSITNIKGQFVYETEKANVHNALLKQIQFGVKLKTTKTNDRSKPVLDGLRKFRRQMTIEEQILKSESRAQLNEPPEEESEDELDDIDKIRDDLQSSKQMLALEMRAKEAAERENKRMLLKIQQLEAELGRERSKNCLAPPGEMSTLEAAAEPPLVSSATNEALLRTLKREAEEALQTSKQLEAQYTAVAEQLDTAKVEIEEQKRTIAMLEKRLSQGGGSVPDRRQSETNGKDSSPEPELAELSDVEDEEEDEEKKAERLARRLAREVKMLSTKLVRLKDKERAARKERENLREAMKKNQALLKVEHKKFKKLQREVDKMAAMMKEDDDEDDEDADDDRNDEPKPDSDAEETEDEETEEESESEESDGESESDDSESEAEDATPEAKKSNYEPRIKRHDGRLTALKKGNYLVQTNVERLQDEINKMREQSVSLQRDLDSVLSELG